DQLAVDAPARGAPLVLFDQGSTIEPETEVARVELVELHDNRLRERAKHHRRLGPCRHVTDAELQRAKTRVRPDVPPDPLRVVDAMQFDEQLDVVLVFAPRTEVIGHTGAREAAEYRRPVRLEAGVPTHPERRTG